MRKRNRIKLSLVFMGIACALWHVVSHYTNHFVFELLLIIAIYASIIMIGSLLFNDDNQRV